MDFSSTESYCGIVCSSCKIYLATKNNSDEIKAVIANEWSLLYEKKIDISAINCLGCKSDQLSGLCKNCWIKKCNINKKYISCHECNIFTCDKLQKFNEWKESRKKVTMN